MQLLQKKPKQARALLKREALVAAGIAEFSAAGFAGATSKSIALRAGVATGTFYQNFNNKDELLLEIAEQRIQVLQQNVRAIKAGDLEIDQANVLAIFRDSLSFIYDFHKSNPELHQVLEERRHLDKELSVILQRGESELLSRVLGFVKGFNLTEPEIIANNLFAMAEGMVHRHVFEAAEFDRETVIDQGAQMLAAFFTQSLT